MYRIRRVDGFDDETADTLHWLDRLCFLDTAPRIDPEKGQWWLCFLGKEPVAFAGMERTVQEPAGWYLCRSGVAPEHRGHGLQVRLLRARENYARRNGYTALVTDTTDNIPSANSLIRAGFRLYEPAYKWAFHNSLYWRKQLA